MLSTGLMHLVIVILFVVSSYIVGSAICVLALGLGDYGI